MLVLFCFGTLFADISYLLCLIINNTVYLKIGLLVCGGSGRAGADQKVQQAVLQGGGGSAAHQQLRGETSRETAH